MEVFVCIDVPDLDRGVDFYTAAGLGLVLARRIGDDVAGLAGASVPIHLVTQPAGTQPCARVARPRDYDRHWTPVHVDFVTADLERAVTAATAAGAVLERNIARRSWNAIAGLADPFGHGFDLLEEPGSPRAGAVDVAIDVPDVGEAVRFYTRALGLALRDEPMAGLWARLGGVPCTIHLQHAPERTYTRHWTPVHVDFLTHDLDPAVARALAAGATLDRPIQSAAWGRMANLADPFGHGFCLVTLGPRGYDALTEQD
jgi:predicted enzyme related to lactoylglutathione lyase